MDRALREDAGYLQMRLRITRDVKLDGLDAVRGAATVEALLELIATLETKNADLVEQRRATLTAWDARVAHAREDERMRAREVA